MQEVQDARGCRRIRRMGSKEGLSRGKIDSGEKVDAEGWREEVIEEEK